MGRKHVISLCVVVSVVLGTTCLGCRNNQDTETRDTALDQISDQLSRISVNATDLADRLFSEASTGHQYLDSKDMLELEEINDELNEIETGTVDDSVTTDAMRERILQMIVRETLYELTSTIGNYIYIRDSKAGLESIQMSLANRNTSYETELYRWLSCISESQTCPYNERELISLLLNKYIQGATDSCLLSFYELDNNIFNSNRQSLQGFLDNCSRSIKRILDEVRELEVPEELALARSELINTLQEMDKQNSFLKDSDWPVMDEADLEKMIEGYIVNRDKIYETISPFLPLSE
ncbi:MAG: hypothetical protein AB1552_14320 [Nitrospirota bacterium]